VDLRSSGLLSSVCRPPTEYRGRHSIHRPRRRPRVGPDPGVLPPQRRLSSLTRSFTPHCRPLAGLGWTGSTTGRNVSISSFVSKKDVIAFGMESFCGVNAVCFGLVSCSGEVLIPAELPTFLGVQLNLFLSSHSILS
jgi:hypothetical protein